MAASTLDTLEERVAALEARLEQIEHRQEPDKSDAPRGWQRIVGIFQDNPDFEEAVRLGREWREYENDTNISTNIEEPC